MATHAEPGTVTPARGLSPYPTDYKIWKVDGVVRARLPVRGLRPLGDRGAQHAAVPAQRARREEVKAHFQEFRLPLLIALSVCLTMTAFYMAWSIAVSRVMETHRGSRRVPVEAWSDLGGTITCAPRS